MHKKQELWCDDAAAAKALVSFNHNSLNSNFAYQIESPYYSDARARFRWTLAECGYVYLIIM